MSNKTILVFGATGNMGGSVIHAILGKGYDLRALVRDPQNTKSELLRKKGVNLVEGNFDDYQSMVSAAKGADIVYDATAGNGPQPTSKRVGFTFLLEAVDVPHDGLKHILDDVRDIIDGHVRLPAPVRHQRRIEDR